MPNGYGKFIFIYKKDELHKHSFVYLGNFLNGFFHGFGKKLNGQGFRLECEFINGKAEGYGKFFFPGGNIMYEGEYKDGAKTGCGCKFYPSGKIMFEGQLIDSKWTGFGRKYFEHNGMLSYEGECLDNVPHGFGRYYNPRLGALWYDGHFKNGKFDGFGSLTNAAEPNGDGNKVLYVGEWRDGMKHGLGTYRYDDDYTFEGRWRHDNKVEGTVTYLNKRFKQIFFTEKDFLKYDGPDHFK